MNKTEELEKKIWSITEIFLETKESFNYCKYFYQQPRESEEYKMANSDTHIQFIRFSLWRQTIIGLSKLFSDKNTDKFKIRDFINRLKSDGYYGDQSLPSNLIIEWEKQIDSHTILISDILVLRDKIYAHTDPNKNEYQNIMVTFSSIESLMNILSNLIIKIHSIVFDSDFDLSLPSDSERIDLLSDLVAQRKIKIEFYK